MIQYSPPEPNMSESHYDASQIRLEIKKLFDSPADQKVPPVYIPTRLAILLCLLSAISGALIAVCFI